MNDSVRNILKVNQNGVATLYHGSRGGIEGKIEPISRPRCDFGKGFYMGTEPMQAKSLISNDDLPYLYTLSIDMSQIDPERILVLNGKDWLYAILANRKNVPEFNNLSVSREYLKKCNDCDLIIGSIADDKMRQAMNAFTENAITDAGLEHCLKYVDYGNQIVAKSQAACNAIQILDCKEIKGLELDEAIQYASSMQKKCRDVVNEARMDYADIGKRLTDYIKEERRIEVGFSRREDITGSSQTIKHKTKFIL